MPNLRSLIQSANVQGVGDNSTEQGELNSNTIDPAAEGSFISGKLHQVQADAVFAAAFGQNHFVGAGNIFMMGIQGSSQNPISMVHAHEADTHFGDRQHERTVAKASSTVASSPVLMNDSVLTTPTHLVGEDTAQGFEVWITAQDSVNGDAKVWRLTGMVKRVGLGLVTVHNLVKTVIAENNAASTGTWDVTIQPSATNGFVEYEVTQGAGNPGEWFATTHFYEVRAL